MVYNPAIVKGHLTASYHFKVHAAASLSMGQVAAPHEVTNLAFYRSCLCAALLTTSMHAASKRDMVHTRADS